MSLLTKNGAEDNQSVYYAHVGNRVIMLTSGGDKKSQSRDIERAVKLLKDWEKRNG